MTGAWGQDGSLFCGAERPRLVLLAVIMVAGWIAVAVFWSASVRRVRQEAPPTAESLPPLPPPDPAPEFQGLQDGRPMSLRDSAAYAALLKRVRQTRPEVLAQAARRDVRFSQLFEDPKRYRGLPIHFEGTALRVLRQQVDGSTLFRDGTYYEAYAITPDSGSNPWFLVFEQAPSGLAVGDDLRQSIEFDGFFLKLLAYWAADRPRVAPVLIGRFPVHQSIAPDAANPNRTWLICLVAVLTLYIAVRVWTQVRRHRTLATRASGARPLIADQIEPDALADWLRRAPNDQDAAAPPGPTGSQGIGPQR